MQYILIVLRKVFYIWEIIVLMMIAIYKELVVVILVHLIQKKNNLPVAAKKDIM